MSPHPRVPPSHYACLAHKLQQDCSGSVTLEYRGCHPPGAVCDAVHSDPEQRVVTSRQKAPRAEKINCKKALKSAGNHRRGAPTRVAISDPSNSPTRRHQRKHWPVDSSPTRMLCNFGKRYTHQNKYSDGLPSGILSGNWICLLRHSPFRVNAGISSYVHIHYFTRTICVAIHDGFRRLLAHCLVNAFGRGTLADNDEEQKW